MAEIKRTVTVFNQNTQEKSVFENVVANTFGELKSFLNRKGISFTDMDVREGISRINLKADSAILPHDTPYRGGTTNDLMILLTKTNKKVSSGIGRSEAVQYIKDNNLQDAVKAENGGKNYTNLSTAVLVAFVEKNMGSKTVKEAPAKDADAPEEKPSKKEVDSCDTISNIKKAVARLVDILYDDDVIDGDERGDVLAILNSFKVEESGDAKSTEKGFSQDEIWDAIRSM